jgi:hypothetical protein
MRESYTCATAGMAKPIASSAAARGRVLYFMLFLSWLASGNEPQRL